LEEIHRRLKLANIPQQFPHLPQRICLYGAVADFSVIFKLS
jgi:hypothetical protein